MRKTIATAFRVSLVLDQVKDEKIRAEIQFDINQAERFGVIYLASCCPQIKVIEDMGFRFKKDKYGYYIFPFFEYLARGEGK